MNLFNIHIVSMNSSLRSQIQTDVQRFAYLNNTSSVKLKWRIPVYLSMSFKTNKKAVAPDDMGLQMLS